MPHSNIKKFKNVLIDRVNDIKYNIYANILLDKKQMIYYVRQFHLNCHKFPDPGTIVNIIADK